MRNYWTHLFKWDFILFAKYRIILITAIIAAIYTIIFRFLPEGSDKFVVFIIFSDPTFMGFMFIGAILLFEKSSHTNQVLSVLPLKLSHYIFSKALVLTLIALGGGLIMVVAGTGFDFNLPIMLTGFTLTSMVFVFLGIAGGSKVRTLNQYILILPLFFIPTALPFLDFFGLWESPLLYIIPTQASLILFEGIHSEISTGNLLYSISYLLLWVAISYYYAYRSLKKNWKY